MRRALYWAARDELRSMRCYAERTKQELRPLIEIPPETRARIERWCALHPRDSEDIVEALLIRDLMLEWLCD